ncbi:hypothetical protein SAMN04489844_0911 [Nocardioides exalbidus]|uniref:Uncharacterized protein n=1 Tax=Nocardioides exalbidus TaxID=402596 RepID=A0A1H4LM66_9ACTN|nr:hypothetical protein [Nocardioides exalbidus]SEB71744.1 hypothetical protein SAMN04489844_0911 [Nocardioides exalbidus]
MPTSGPVDPDLRGRWLRERRAVIRDHHPDRGGDAEAMRTRLEELDARYARLEVPLDDRRPSVRRIGRVVTRVRRELRSVRRAGQARLPRGWPGSRRYFDL